MYHVVKWKEEIDKTGDVYEKDTKYYWNTGNARAYFYSVNNKI